MRVVGVALTRRVHVPAPWAALPHQQQGSMQWVARLQQQQQLGVEVVVERVPAQASQRMVQRARVLAQGRWAAVAV